MTILLRFGMTCNRKFGQPLSYWVVKVGGRLSLFCFFLAHLHVETVVSSLSSKYPKVGVNHQDQALRNWFEILVTHFSIFSNQQLIVSLYSFSKKKSPNKLSCLSYPNKPNPSCQAVARALKHICRRAERQRCWAKKRMDFPLMILRGFISWRQFFHFNLGQIV